MSKNKLPLISVILATFNRAHVILRAVDSVLSQTYANIELIVIDDGSSDDTEQCLSRYKNKLTYLYQQNKGVSNARNEAIAHAKGAYLAFIDSDDEWYPDKLSKQFDFMQRHSVEMISCAFKTFDQGNCLKTKKLPKQFSKTIKDFEDVFAYPYLGTSSVLIKMTCFIKVGGFKETLNTAEDLDFFLRVAAKHTVGFLDLSLVNKYESEEGLGAGLNSYEDNLSVVIEIVQKHQHYFASRNNLVKQVMSNLHVAYARSLLWQKKTRQARKLLLSAMHYKKTLECCLLILKSYMISEAPEL